MGVKIDRGTRRIQYTLSMEEEIMTQRAIREERKSIRQILREGVRLHEMAEHKDIRLMRERLMKRLGKGVSRAYIIELKILYVMLGHYLQRIEEG